jgi:hypothetical protein
MLAPNPGAHLIEQLRLLRRGLLSRLGNGHLGPRL